MYWLQNMDSEFTDHVALQFAILFGLLFFHRILFRNQIQTMPTLSRPLLILLKPVLDLVVGQDGRLIWHWSCILWYQISEFFRSLYLFASCLIIGLILSVPRRPPCFFSTLSLLFLSVISPILLLIFIFVLIRISILLLHVGCILDVTRIIWVLSF